MSGTSIVIPGLYGQATMRWTYIPAGKQYTVTIGLDDTPHTGDAGAAATVYNNAMKATNCPAAAASMSTAWRFEGVNVLMRLVTGVLVTADSGFPTTGTATPPTNTQPVFLPAIVKKKTALAGRRYRGRMYAPFTLADENVVDQQGIVQTATLNTLNVAWGLFFTAVNSSAYTPQLLHTLDPAGLAVAPTPITGLIIAPVVGVQRRRRAKGA